LDGRLLDVLKMDIERKKVGVIAFRKKKRDAEAICPMAILRHACNDWFFAVTLSVKYAEGDIWKG